MSASRIACPRCGKEFGTLKSIGGHKLKCGVTYEELFWVHVDKNGSNGCWQWTGCRDNNGYGKIGKIRAHRISWQIANGPIPKGMHVLHKCDNPTCSRPSHLHLGTALDNANDRQARGRSAVGNAQPNAVLNPSKVRRIRALRAKGLSYAKIGAAVGCNDGAARCVCIGKFWRHVA